MSLLGLNLANVKITFTFLFFFGKHDWNFDSLILTIILVDVIIVFVI